MDTVNNKNTLEAKIRVLDKVYDNIGKVVRLKVIYSTEVLVGFDVLGNKIFKRKKKEQIIYGMCKTECLNKLKTMLNIEPYHVRFHRVSGYILHDSL